MTRKLRAVAIVGAVAASGTLLAMGLSATTSWAVGAGDAGSTSAEPSLAAPQEAPFSMGSRDRAIAVPQAFGLAGGGDAPCDAAGEGAGGAGTGPGGGGDTERDPSPTAEAF